jgi:DNA replication protein DnaC
MNRLIEILEELNKRGLIADLDKEKTELTPEERKERSRIASESRCKTNNAMKGNLNEFDGYDCPKCLNRGYTLVSKDCGAYYDEVMVICKCKSVRKALERLKDSGLKNVVSDYRFDNYKTDDEWQKKLLDTAKSFVDNEDGRWFFIGGQSGIGKSHLCTAISISLLKKGNDVKYMLWQDEVSELKRTLNNPTIPTQLETYKNVDVLYIDDLFKTGRENGGLQKPTLADIKLAFEILNTRIAKRKVTIISTECTLPELIEIDEALAGRIKQLCGNEYCLSIGKDRNKNYRLR